jgi:hypothetical protein
VHVKDYLSSTGSTFVCTCVRIRHVVLLLIACGKPFVWVVPQLYRAYEKFQSDFDANTTGFTYRLRWPQVLIDNDHNDDGLRRSTSQTFWGFSDR